MMKQDKITFFEDFSTFLRIKMTFSSLYQLEMIKPDKIAFLQILTVFGTRI